MIQSEVYTLHVSEEYFGEGGVGFSQLARLSRVLGGTLIVCGSNGDIRVAVGIERAQETPL